MIDRDSLYLMLKIPLMMVYSLTGGCTRMSEDWYFVSNGIVKDMAHDKDVLEQVFIPPFISFQPKFKVMNEEAVKSWRENPETIYD